MYTRSYSDGSLSLPEGYSGTAFAEPPVAEPEEVAASPAEDTAEVSKEESVSTGLFGSMLSRLPLGGFLGKAGLRIPKIGTEEILILAAAAFLFFSEGGDKECAIMLLLLLFI